MCGPQARGIKVARISLATNWRSGGEEREERTDSAPGEPLGSGWLSLQRTMSAKETGST